MSFPKVVVGNLFFVVPFLITTDPRQKHSGMTAPCGPPLVRALLIKRATLFLQCCEQTRRQQQIFLMFVLIFYKSHRRKHILGNISMPPCLKTLEIGAVLLKIGVFTAQKRINPFKMKNFLMFSTNFLKKGGFGGCCRFLFIVLCFVILGSSLGFVQYLNFVPHCRLCFFPAHSVSRPFPFDFLHIVIVEQLSILDA